MTKRSPTSLNQKLQAVQRCLGLISNPNYEAKLLGVSHGAVKRWIRKYTTDGLEGLKESSKWTAYTPELKLAAVRCLVWSLLLNTGN